MPERTRKKDILQELYQAVVGIPENPDENGLIGKVDDLIVAVKAQNNRVGKVEQKVSKIWGIIIASVALGGTGLGLGLTQ